MRDLDKMIEKIMREQKRALSITTVSSLSGLSRNLVKMKMKKLEKNGRIKLHNTMKVRFYKLSDK